jgi:hypothetical protein
MNNNIRLSLRSFVLLFGFALSRPLSLAGSHEQRAGLGHSNSAKGNREGKRNGQPYEM